MDMSVRHWHIRAEIISVIDKRQTPTTERVVTTSKFPYFIFHISFVSFAELIQ